MSDAPEVSESGQPILRHAPRATEFEFAAGDPENLQRISAHIGTHLGPIDTVFHEILSDLVHVDVHILNPRPDRNFYTLVTSGMSDRPMAAPPGAEGHEYAELLLCLPPTWPMSEERMRQDENYWPIFWLKRLARFPHEYSTWLSWGHTIPNGDPAAPFSASTRLCGMILLPPKLAPPEFFELAISPEKAIRFYALVPLYQEEMDFKLKRGADALCDKLDAQQVSELLDIRRANVCKSGFSWFRR